MNFNTRLIIKIYKYFDLLHNNNTVQLNNIKRNSHLQDLLDEPSTLDNINIENVHPFISIKIFNSTFFALIDSDAQCCIVNQQIFENLKNNNDIQTLPLTNSFIQGVLDLNVLASLINVYYPSPYQMSLYIMPSSYLQIYNLP